MLKKSEKLRGANRIKRLVKKGVKISTPLFLLKYLENKPMNTVGNTQEKRGNTKEKNHFAVVISKKISLEAVKRNKLRRRLYAAIRTNKNLLPKTSSFDMLFIVKPPIQTASYSEIKDIISTLFKKF